MHLFNSSLEHCSLDESVHLSCLVTFAVNQYIFLSNLGNYSLMVQSSPLLEFAFMEATKKVSWEHLI